MADERLLITIEGKDGVSKTFVAVGKSADAAGKSVEASGKAGGTAMKHLAEETERTAASAEDLSRKYTAVGAAIGASLGVISKLGASYRDQRLDLQSLEDQYGSSADAVIDFTEAIQDSFNQSNDAARDSALTFATLYRNYEMGESQIIELMERTADISAARGRNMTETSQMIQNALRGEAEYIEQIGVTLNDTYVASEYAARGLGNWNTLTDEAAKAQFRYVLLMEQTADTQGRAAEEAERAGGIMRRGINEMQDMGQAAGKLLGPLGEMGAEFSQIAIGLPVVAGGIGRMVGMLRNAQGGFVALSAAAAPWVIAAGAALAIGYKLWDSYQEGARVIETLKDSYIELTAASQAAIISGNPEQAAWLDQLRFQVESVRGEADATRDYIKETLTFRGDDLDPIEYQELDAAYHMNGEEASRLAESQRKLGAALQDNRIDGEALAAEMDSLYWQFMRQEITLDEYNDQMEALSNNTAAYTIVAEDASAAQIKLNEALADGAISASDMGLMARVAVMGIEEIADASRRGTRVANESNRERRKTFDLWLEELSYIERIGYATRQHMGIQLDLNGAVEQSNRERRSTAALLREEANAVQSLGMDTLDLAIATQEAAEARERLRGSAGALGAGAFEEATGSIEEYNEQLEQTRELLSGILDLTGDGDFLSQWNMTSAASEASLLAENLNDVAGALDTTYRVIVGNTNAIANQVDGIHSWAEELINVEGAYGEIDRLLAAGLITQEQYNDAQLAYNDIATSNLQIHDDVLAIQAQQAPLIAAQTVAMADYVEQLRLMNDGTAEGAAKQLEALGWMDTELQNQAMNVTLFADQLDDLGAGGEAAFGSMVDSIVATNPALAEMLVTMGYITDVARDENGRIISYSVDLDGGDDAMSEIERLTLSIDALIVALGGVPPGIDIAVTDNASESTAAFGNLQLQVGLTDGMTATVNAYANDQASGILASLAANWGGTIATAWIDVVTRNVPGKAEGGVVGYAGGGTIPVELAEAGGEVIHFASGGTAYVGQRGVYGLAAGDYVVPHNAVSNSYGGDVNLHFHIAGSVITDGDLTERVMSKAVPILSDVLQEKRRTAGVA